MITKAPIGDNERSLLSPTLFEKLGRLCFTQLLELRHRGAFSTVSQTFAAFCRRCATSNIPSLRALPETWYQVCASTKTACSLLMKIGNASLHTRQGRRHHSKICWYTSAHGEHSGCRHRRSVRSRYERSCCRSVGRSPKYKYRGIEAASSSCVELYQGVLHDIQAQCHF